MSLINTRSQLRSECWPLKRRIDQQCRRGKWISRIWLHSDPRQSFHHHHKLCTDLYPDSRASPCCEWGEHQRTLSRQEGPREIINHPEPNPCLVRIRYQSWLSRSRSRTAENHLTNTLKSPIRRDAYAATSWLANSRHRNYTMTGPKSPTSHSARIELKGTDEAAEK